MTYNSDNYVSATLGIIFCGAGVCILWNVFSRILPNGWRPKEAPGRAEKFVPLRYTFPLFAYGWVILLGISMLGSGLHMFVDSLIYANTHHRQSSIGLVFWIPYAFCLGTAGMFGSKENFKNLNPVTMLFFRLVASVFVIGSLGLGFVLMAHGILRLAVVEYMTAIRHFLDTGQPLT